MLDPRIYRAALVVVLLAAIVSAFALGNRPRPIGTTVPPDAFNGARARSDLDRLASQYPSRRPGSSGDDAMAAAIAAELRGISHSYEVSTVSFGGETIDGDRTLKTVIARQIGAPGPQLVVVAHRDAAGRGAKAELSGTAAMLEIARAVADGRARRSITFVSTSGGSGGNAGAADAVKRLGGPVDAVLVLGDLASVHARRPFVVGWSNSKGVAPLQLQRTIAAAVRSESGAYPGFPRGPVQWARLAFPATVGEQGSFLSAGMPAALLSVTGERPPAADSRVSTRRLQSFGRAALRTIDALDNAPDLHESPTADLLTLRKVIPAWTVRLMVLALLLPPLLVTVDGFARARRRHAALGSGLRRHVVLGLPFLLAAAFAWFLGVTGLAGPTPPNPVDVTALPAGTRGAVVLCAIVLVLVLGWLVVRPAMSRRLGVTGAPDSEGAGIAMLMVLCVAALLMWLGNPYAAGLLVPATHLWLLIVAPELRMRRWLAIGLVLVALLPLALVGLVFAHSLALGPLDFAWWLFLLVGGEHIGPWAWIVWSALAACLLVAISLAWRERRPRVEEEPRVTVRGPVTYAGPGSLGGTESALRQ